MGSSVHETTMADGASKVNEAAWDERYCCTAGEARAGSWLHASGVLTAKRGREAHGHAVSAARRARPCGRPHSADIGAGCCWRRAARTLRSILAAAAVWTAVPPPADRVRCALARV